MYEISYIMSYPVDNKQTDRDKNTTSFVYYYSYVLTVWHRIKNFDTY